MRVRFGSCVLDSELHELTREGRPVELSPKAFRVLRVLLERRPGVVAHADLRGLVWPDATAGGTTLARLVNEVRRAIGDPARRPRFIRTVARVGYAFAGPASEEPRAEASAPPRCVLQWGLRQVPLAPGENVIGRAAEALISVASPKVSRRHARILVAEGRATLEDLDSKNGTYLGERRIAGPQELKHGDRISIGPLVLVFCVANAEETASSPGDR